VGENIPVEGVGAAPLPEGKRPGWRDNLLWALLVFTSTTLLLSVTTFLTQNVAPVPFLWVLPLSLYLLSFILAFNPARWVWKPYWLLLVPVSLAVFGADFTSALQLYSFAFILPLNLLAFFLACMVCHGELARTKPDPAYLTGYYLMVSLGGALGGVFVGIISPLVFSDNYEFPIGVGLFTGVALLRLYGHPQKGFRHPAWLLSAAIAGAYLYVLGSLAFVSKSLYRVTDRNFYGALKVFGVENLSTHEVKRVLQHGTIYHGVEFLRPVERMREPTTYYGRFSGVGLAVQEAEKRPNTRVGVIGLGAGTLSAYAKAGDTYRFYEINPAVVQIATTQFHFLRECPARVEIVPGDARLSLEGEPPQNYDVLAVDAFSSDSIPVHLLTKEAFQLYFRHLKPGGVLAVHTSNSYLNLGVVVERQARELGKQCRIVSSMERPEVAVQEADWVLVTENPGYFNIYPLNKAGRVIPPRNDLRAWTDDYSNLVQIIE
jgi:spermidine synthase